MAVQRPDPNSHLNAVRRLLAARRWAACQLLDLDRTGAPSDPDPLVAEVLTVSGGRAGPGTGVGAGQNGPGTGAPVAAYRRAGLWAVLNLHDGLSTEVDLPAPAIFDTDDPAVTANRPRTGRMRLAPQQALLLAAIPR